MKQRIKLLAATLAGIGIPGVGEVHMVMRSGAYEPYSYWTDLVDPDRHHTSIITAESKMTSGRNDVLLVTPDNHSLASSLTWDGNMTHMVGMFPPGYRNSRARIGMSTTFTPMMTISGYGNLFYSMYWMHGTAATDVTGLQITGHRNRFRYCHFGSPMVAAQGATSNYIGVLDINSSENYFYKCTIGTESIGRDEATPNVTFAANTGDNIFEECIFNLYLTDGDPLFATFENTSTVHALFKRCTFVAHNANWATSQTKAFNFTGGATAGCFLEDCNFINVGALAASDKDQFVWLSRPFVTTTDTEGGIAAQLTI